MNPFLARVTARAHHIRHSQAWTGRGIVTCAGGALLFTNAYVLVRVLRETLACRLPIQLWHFGGGELSPAMRHILRALDVELVDAAGVMAQFPADIRDGWQLKSYALLHARFAEILFLDADQVPVRNPEFLFETPEYADTGAIFWPDIVDLRADNPIWAQVGLPAEICPSWESGQILVDKRRHAPALRIALALNEQAEIIYAMLYGDKDTFLIAWRLAEATAAIAPHRPFCDRDNLIQRDFAGAPLFQHCTGEKWRYQGGPPRSTSFVHAAACEAFLADLRALWNGRLFFPPDRSLAARNEEARLAAVGVLRLIEPGCADRSLAPLPGGQFGLGRRAEWQNWHIEETPSGFEWIVHDGARPVARLRQAPNGVWLGEGQRGEIRVEEPVDAADLNPAIAGGLLAAMIEASGYQGLADEPPPAALVSALNLLLQAEPGLRAALDPFAVGAMGALACSLAVGVEVNRAQPVRYDIAVLATGYQPPEPADLQAWPDSGF